MPAKWRIVYAPDWAKIVTAPNSYGFEEDVAMAIDEAKCSTLVHAAVMQAKMAEDLARMTALAAYFLQSCTLTPEWSDWPTDKAIDHVRAMACGQQDHLFSPADRERIEACRKAACETTPIVEPAR